MLGCLAAFAGLVLMARLGSVALTNVTSMNLTAPLAAAGAAGCYLSECILQRYDDVECKCV